MISQNHLDDIWGEGYDAFINEIPLEGNPYQTDIAHEWRAWRYGWLAAEGDYERGK